MKSSIFSSTLSMAFAACVVTVIILIFTTIEPNEKLLGVLTMIIGAYLTARNPNTAQSVTTSTSDDTTVVTTTPDAPPEVPFIPKKKR